MKRHGLVVVIILSLALFLSPVDANKAWAFDKPDEDEIIEVSRKQLHNDFDDYEDEWVRVAGPFATDPDSDDNAGTISIEGPSALKMIMCDLQDGVSSAGLAKGDYVTVVGYADMKVIGQVMLEECYIEATGADAKSLDKSTKADYGESKESESTSSNSGKRSSALFGTADIDKDNAIQVTAKEVYKEMEDNQVACKNKYDGETVAITGTIENFGTNIYGQEYLIFNTGDPYSLTSVQCFFKDDQMDYVASLKKGDKITIYGIADVGSMSFKMGNCQP